MNSVLNCIKNLCQAGGRHATDDLYSLSIYSKLVSANDAVRLSTPKDLAIVDLLNPKSDIAGSLVGYDVTIGVVSLVFSVIGTTEVTTEPKAIDVAMTNDWLSLYPHPLSVRILDAINLLCTNRCSLLVTTASSFTHINFHNKQSTELGVTFSASVYRPKI